MNCFCCGQEVGARDCARCASGHARIGQVEFVWNGWVVKRVDVGWCPKCDHAWIVDGSDERPICGDCRARMRALGQPGMPAEIAA